MPTDPNSATAKPGRDIDFPWASGLRDKAGRLHQRDRNPFLIELVVDAGLLSLSA
jgi:hypothetical protein